MSALYIMRVVGGLGPGIGAVYIGRKTMLGVGTSAGGKNIVRYSGNYTESDGRLRGTMNLTLQNGTSIPLNFDWPEDLTSSPQSVSAQGRMVNITFQKLGDIP
jgi:hypothetical protein